MTHLVPLLAALLAAPGGDGVAPVVPASLEDPAADLNKWTGALTLGATWSTGNTETQTVNGGFNAQRRGEKDRWTLDGFLNYGESTDTITDDKTTTTNNSGGGVKYDYFSSKKLYYFGNASGKVDHVADLGLRAVVGAGLGYQWAESEKVKWGTELGVSYVDENFDDDTFDADFVAGRIGSNLVYQISKSASFEQVAEILPSLEDSEDLIAKIDNRLKMNITGKWFAQIQYVLDFDGSVPSGVNPGPDGKEETDHRVVLSLGWNFG